MPEMKDATELQLTVPGMGSDHCAAIVRESLKRLSGMRDIQTSIASHRVRVSVEPVGPDSDRLRAAVESAGYDVAAVHGGGSRRIRLNVPGMGSDHCAGIVRSTLERLEGVRDIETSIASHRVTVSVGADGPSGEALRKAVEAAGYDVASMQAEEAGAGADGEADAEIEEAYLTQARKRLWIAAVPTTIIMLLMVPHMFWQQIPGYLAIVALLAFPVVFLYGGAATHKAAWRSLTNRTFNMDAYFHGQPAALPDRAGRFCLPHDLLHRDGRDHHDIPLAGPVPGGMDSREPKAPKPGVTRRQLRNPRLWMLLAVVAGVTHLLLRDEHESHFLGALPWLLLLACPFTHLFMHHSHKHHHDEREINNDTR